MRKYFTQLALYIWQANAERLLIEGQSAIENARLKAEAEEIIHSSELEIQTEMRHSELAYVKESNNLEISKAQQLSDIEVNKWRQLLDMCIKWWIIVYNLTFLKFSHVHPSYLIFLYKNVGYLMLIVVGKSHIVSFVVCRRSYIGYFEVKSVKSKSWCAVCYAMFKCLTESWKIWKIKYTGYALLHHWCAYSQA